MSIFTEPQIDWHRDHRLVFCWWSKQVYFSSPQIFFHKTKTSPLPVPADCSDLWVNLWHHGNQHQTLSVISRSNYPFFFSPPLTSGRLRGLKVNAVSRFLCLSQGCRWHIFALTFESHKQLTYDPQSNKPCYRDSAEEERWKRQFSFSCEGDGRKRPLIFTQWLRGKKGRVEREMSLCEEL